MIMNALNGVQSDNYLLKTIIQGELQKLIKILPKKIDFKDIKFPVKVIDKQKIKKK